MENNCKLKNVIAEISKTSKNLYIVTTGLSEGLPPTWYLRSAGVSNVVLYDPVNTSCRDHKWEFISLCLCSQKFL